MISKWILTLTVLLILTNCKTTMEETDLIVKHGVIYTLDGDFSIAEAMAINNGKVVETGTTDEILKKYHAQKVLDANGKAVYPGFIDAHCHFLGYGENTFEVNLVGTSSFDEVIERVHEHSQAHDVLWVVGRGWDQNDWKEQHFPSKHKLDSLFPDKPVALKRIDGHALLVNQKALDLFRYYE